MGNIVLYPINFSDEISIPIVLILLVLGAIFYIEIFFVNIHFSTAIKLLGETMTTLRMKNMNLTKQKK